MGYAIGGGCGAAMIVLGATDTPASWWAVAFGAALVVAALILAILS